MMNSFAISEPVKTVLSQSTSMRRSVQCLKFSTEATANTNRTHSMAQLSSLHVPLALQEPTALFPSRQTPEEGEADWGFYISFDPSQEASKLQGQPNHVFQRFQRLRAGANQQISMGWPSVPL